MDHLTTRSYRSARKSTRDEKATLAAEVSIFYSDNATWRGIWREGKPFKTKQLPKLRGPNGVEWIGQWQEGTFQTGYLKIDPTGKRCKATNGHPESISRYVSSTSFGPWKESELALSVSEQNPRGGSYPYPHNPLYSMLNHIAYFTSVAEL